MQHMNLEGTQIFRPYQWCNQCKEWDRAKWTIGGRHHDIFLGDEKWQYLSYDPILVMLISSQPSGIYSCYFLLTRNIFLNHWLSKTQHKRLSWATPGWEIFPFQENWQSRPVERNLRCLGNREHTFSALQKTWFVRRDHFCEMSSFCVTGRKAGRVEGRKERWERDRGKEGSKEGKERRRGSKEREREKGEGRRKKKKGKGPHYLEENYTSLTICASTEFLVHYNTRVCLDCESKCVYLRLWK